MKLILLVFVVAFISVSSQHLDIDSYTSHATPVLEISESDCLTKLVVKSADMFAVRDRVCIQQVKGMQISSNATDSGAQSESGYAGNFELGTIERIEGTTVYLSGRLARRYDVQHRVQLIEVLMSETINIRGVVTCEPWDGESGGTVVVEATDTLLHNGLIVVSGKGFRGGETSEYYQSCGLAWDCLLYTSPSPRD